MKRLPKTTVVSVALDEVTALMLDRIAEAECEANRSRTIRKALAEAAERRGLTQPKPILTEAVQ